MKIYFEISINSIKNYIYTRRCMLYNIIVFWQIKYFYQMKRGKLNDRKRKSYSRTD